MRKTEERKISQRKRRLWASIFIVPGLLLILFGGQTTTLVCQRTKSGIDCRVEGNFMGIRMRRTEIPQLQSAEVESSTSSDYGTTYRVVLVSKSGKVPLTSSYSGGRDSKQEAVDRINAFIANPSGQPSLQIQRLGWRGWMWGGAMLLIGVWDLEKQKGQRRRKKRAFGRIGR